VTPSISILQPTYIQEWDDAFLSLWPHRYDYIQAKHPTPGEKPDWSTERRHPLSDRLIRQGSYLYGVRFGKLTHYCTIDIDIDSAYHPKQDPFAFQRMQDALEPLGLVRSIICTSSYSKGIHLYFPFEEAQFSWKIAAAVTTLLENQGFKIAPGQLEVFPNLKPYLPEGAPTLYNAHRLPMQAGSYLLNDALEPIWSSQERFVSQWQLAQAKNDINAATLELLLKQARRVRYRITTKADKFLNDLNAEIELGWTGPHQTNHIIGRIAMRSYIFGHILYAEDPLEGQALIDDVIAIAIALPGYAEFCGHQDEIEKRAKEWARSVEGCSRYFHYGRKSPDKTEADDTPTWNELQAEAARDRIRAAIADQLDRGTLPATTTARFKTLTSYGISGKTLYANLDLWHPEHLWKTPSDSPSSNKTSELDCLEGASSSESPESLLLSKGCNSPTNKELNNSKLPDLATAGCNSLLDKASSDLVPAETAAEAAAETDNIEPMGIEQVRAAIAKIQAAKQAAKEQRAEEQRLAREAQAAVHREAKAQQMRQFLASGDLILRAEALAWMQENPGIIDDADIETPMQCSLPLFDVEVAFEFDREPPPEPLDFSEILTAISFQLQRLGWDKGQVSQRLQDLFGKKMQSRLDDMELVEWLHWLEGACKTHDIPEPSSLPAEQSHPDQDSSSGK